MQSAVDNTQSQLGELGAMAAQTTAMEQQILSIAQKRLPQVQAELDQLRAAGDLQTDKQAAAQYQHLVLERGRLNQVIASSQATLQGE